MGLVVFQWVNSAVLGAAQSTEARRPIRDGNSQQDRVENKKPTVKTKRCEPGACGVRRGEAY